ncbi:MAG: hypothetical protein MUP45_00080 [Candidatus Marinimicrobia bacterium]|nr:hypothetical protein [Candidatus Neomarinimicrobiota bacterium]
MKVFDILKVDRYYKMSDHALELEAAKYKIGGYGNPHTGRVIRERIITQLLEKDKANNSRYAIVISLVALTISILALIL